MGDESPAGGTDPLDLVKGHEEDAERAAVQLLNDAWLQATDRGLPMPAELQERVGQSLASGTGMLVALVMLGYGERVARGLGQLEPGALRMVAGHAIEMLADQAGESALRPVRGRESA